MLCVPGGGGVGVCTGVGVAPGVGVCVGGFEGEPDGALVGAPDGAVLGGVPPPELPPGLEIGGVDVPPPPPPPHALSPIASAKKEP